MANPSVHGVVVLLVGVAAVAGAPGPAHARSDEMAVAETPQWVEQTVYRPNCPRVEYDEACLFDPCSADCEPH
ncbi:MAG TPA: hypothetical protein VLX44_09135 [Xanthobacteraceae bacterium]|nr:hypothetical protein [Xanthobacteraceae bacterium]